MIDATNENLFDMLFDMSKCVVSFLDSDGIKHAVELDADGLYEATARALKVFRKRGLDPSSGTKLSVEVVTSVTHELTIKQFETWLNRRESPKQVTATNRVRALLE